jgi:hypothetical protein
VWVIGRSVAVFTGEQLEHDVDRDVDQEGEEHGLPLSRALEHVGEQHDHKEYLEPYREHARVNPLFVVRLAAQVAQTGR